MILDLGLRVTIMDAGQLKNYLLEKTKIQDDRIDFLKYAQKIIDNLKQENRISSANTYRQAIKNLTAYMNGQPLYIHNINSQFLMAWENHLHTFGKRVPSAYMTVVQAIFNRARDEYNDEDNVIIRINNPFRIYKKPKQNIARKRGLTSEEIIKIFNYTPVKSLDEFSKDIFMLSFYLAGINSIDLYYAPPVKNGYLTYCRTKTKKRRSDEAFIQIRIEPEAIPLVEKYKGDEHHAFDFHLRYTSPARFNEVINKGLKIIGNAVGIESLQYYAARHSCASIGRNECGIDKYTINELLNHSDPEMSVTDKYIQKDFSLIWNAQRKIIDFITLK
jgi:integrase